MSVPHSSSTLVEELRGEGPYYIQQWVSEIVTGKRAEPSPFNWLLLSEMASTQTQLAVDSGTLDIEWGRATIAICNLQAARISRQPFQQTYERRAMSTRILLIRRHGPDLNDPARDPTAALRWFFDRLPMSREEALARSREFRTATKEQIGQRILSDRRWFADVARIKERLLVIQSLMDMAVLEPDPEIRAWLAELPALL